MYIQSHVGLQQDGSVGDLYFNELLNDWSRFDINKRTKFDATISSGLAIMACNKNKYSPVYRTQKKKVQLSFNRYDNNGSISKIIK